MPPLLILRDIHLTFGGPPLLDGADFAVSEGDRLCLVGRNGSGKSTLLKIAAGLIQPDTGERDIKRGVTIRYLPQEPDLSAFPNTLAYVEDGLGPHDDLHRARYLVEQLGLTGAEEPGKLSGGEQRRAALARTLAPEPDILLLDEPTNHLDLPLIEWLETALAGTRSALAIISHDRRFLSTLTRTTVWLDRGATRRVDRGFADFEAWRDEQLEQEERERHKLDRKIAREEDWVRYGVSGRRKRNQRRLAALGDLRQTRCEERRVTGQVAMPGAGAAELSAKLVIEAKNVTKSYGDRPIVADFSIRIARGDRIGIVGPNGAGKTTLLNLLNGALAPDQGSVRHGANLETVTLDQSRDSLGADTILQDVLTGGHGDQVVVNGTPRHVIGYMQDFLFEPSQARIRVSALSGGERGRLMLARALAKPSNVLVLDEPTNDLDLDTLELLQETLADYPGTVMLVSHDRDFLDRVVTMIIAYDGPGRWTVYAGGYSDMVAQRGHGVETRAPAAAAPKAAAAKDAAPRAPSKGKLSFKDAHALRTLPDRIAALEAEITQLRASLSAGDLFARDPEAFQKKAGALEAAEKTLATLEDEWLTAEMRRAELDD